MPEIAHLLGATKNLSQTPEGEKPKEENTPTNNENKEKKEKDDSEIKLNRTRRALERIRGRRFGKKIRLNKKF